MIGVGVFLVVESRRLDLPPTYADFIAKSRHQANMLLMGAMLGAFAIWVAIYYLVTHGHKA